MLVVIIPYVTALCAVPPVVLVYKNPCGSAGSNTLRRTPYLFLLRQDQSTPASSYHHVYLLIVASYQIPYKPRNSILDDCDYGSGALAFAYSADFDRGTGCSRRPTSSTNSSGSSSGSSSGDGDRSNSSEALVDEAKNAGVQYIGKGDMKVYLSLQARPKGEQSSTVRGLRPQLCKTSKRLCWNHGIELHSSPFLLDPRQLREKSQACPRTGRPMSVMARFLRELLKHGRASEVGYPRWKSAQAMYRVQREFSSFSLMYGVDLMCQSVALLQAQLTSIQICCFIRSILATNVASEGLAQPHLVTLIPSVHHKDQDTPSCDGTVEHISVHRNEVEPIKCTFFQGREK